MTNKLKWMIVCMLAISAIAKAQTGQITTNSDSVIIPSDSIRNTVKVREIGNQNNDSIQIISDSILSLENKVIIKDTLSLKEEFSPIPKRAVIYSAIMPGLGQVYNKKYWKLPILYGGFFGFTYAITWNNRYYRDYFVGYHDLIDDNDATNAWHNFIPYGQNPDSVDKQWLSETLKRRKDYYRRYRDLSIIGTAVLYALNIVDAYVDASLFNFEMSTDLSLNINPAVIQSQQLVNQTNTAFGLQCSFSF
jgi:hypothetical protein